MKAPSWSGGQEKRGAQSLVGTIQGIFLRVPIRKNFEWTARDVALNAFPGGPRQQPAEVRQLRSPGGCSLGSLPNDLDLESAALVAAHDFR